MFNKTINYTKYPQIPVGPQSFDTFVYQNNLMYYHSSKKHTLNLLQSPPENNPIAAMIMKGQKYNTPFKSLKVNAIPNQAEFTIDGTTKTADKNLEIHVGQYESINEFPINVWRE